MNHLNHKTYIFGTIFTLSNKLQMLGDRMDSQLTVKQWLFLAGVLECRSGNPTLSEIAAYIGSSRQNIKKMALLLEKQGFILMNKDEGDARMLRVSLTDSCKEHLRQREEMERQFIEEVFLGFGTEELAAFSGSVKRLGKNITGMEGKVAK